jgi:hypothetical protein
MGSRMSLPSPPPVPISVWAAPSARPRSTLPEQAAWTAGGLGSLFLLVLIAHAAEIGFDCTLYGIYNSDGIAGGCPVLSWPTLVMLVCFAISSSAIALGLSGSLFSLLPSVGAQSRRSRAKGDARRLALEFTAPFLAFFGWGVLAWGLTVPVLENCIEPCGYPTFPYVLGGTALQLSVLGGGALMSGGALLARLWQTQRRKRLAEKGPTPLDAAGRPPGIRNARDAR